MQNNKVCKGVNLNWYAWCNVSHSCWNYFGSLARNGSQTEKKPLFTQLLFIDEPCKTHNYLSRSSLNLSVRKLDRCTFYKQIDKQFHDLWNNGFNFRRSPRVFALDWKLDLRIQFIFLLNQRLTPKNKCAYYWSEAEYKNQNVQKTAFTMITQGFWIFKEKIFGHLKSFFGERS